MKTLPVSPFEWERNPNDVVFTTRAVSLEAYREAWFARCQRDAIDYPMPRIEEVYPEDEPVGRGVRFFIPDVDGGGVYAPGRTLCCWSLREPYAHLGAHTASLSHVALHQVARAKDAIPAVLLRLLEDKRTSCFSDHPGATRRNRYAWLDPTDPRWSEALTALTDIEPDRRAASDGVLCYCDREGNVRPHMRPHKGESGEELLAHTVMKDAAAVWVDALDVRLLTW